MSKEKAEVQVEDIELADHPKLRIKFITWNVGNEEPEKSEVSDLYGDLDSIDIFVVGLQECEYKAKSSFSKEASSQCKKFHFPSLTESVLK